MVDFSKEYYKNSYDYYILFEKIIENEYAIIAEKMIEIIGQSFLQDKLLCLDVGSGTGKMPNTLIPLLTKDNKEIIFDFLDSSRQSLEVYKKSVPENNLGTEIYGDVLRSKLSKKYDLIMANNSLCGFDFTGVNIQNLLSSLKPDGFAIITLPSDRSDWAIFSKKYWKKMHTEKTLKTRFEHLTDILNRNNILHQEFYVNVPIILDESDVERQLETIFKMMLYTDPDQPNYQLCFSHFKQDYYKNNECFQFVYGIVVLEGVKVC